MPPLRVVPAMAFVNPRGPRTRFDGTSPPTRHSGRAASCPQSVLRSRRCADSRYARRTRAPRWIAVDIGVLMMKFHRTALAVSAAVVGMLLLLAGAVLVADGAVLDVRLARLLLFAGVTVLAVAAVVSVESSLLRAGRRRMRVR